MLRWVLWAWWNLMIISNESMDFNDPKELDDPQLFDDTSYLMIPAIRLFYFLLPQQHNDDLLQLNLQYILISCQHQQQLGK